MDNENKIMHMLTQIQDGIKQQPAAAGSPDVDLEVIAKLDSSFIELNRVIERAKGLPGCHPESRPGCKNDS
jgi:hypothetical protein